MRKIEIGRVYQILGLIGALLWAGTVLLRGTAVNTIPAPNFVLGVMPNFGVVFVLNNLAREFGPLFLNRWSETLLSPLVLYPAIYGALLLSEIIHHFFLAAPFDIWDMAVSLLAVGMLLLVDLFYRK